MGQRRKDILCTGVQLPVADYGVLSAACERNCKKQGLQFFDSFFTKIVQLCGSLAYYLQDADISWLFVLWSEAESLTT